MGIIDSNTQRDIKKFCYIIIVNYKGWKDTIECVESILKSDYPYYKIIICDNNSADDSIEMIRKWATGAFIPDYLGKSPLRSIIEPMTDKPIDIEVISERKIRGYLLNKTITVISCKKNGGFARGNNIGIKAALTQGNCEYVWCLNNDTVIERTCLSRLIHKMRCNTQIGICGAMARSYFEPEKIQCAGGMKYNRWTSRMRKLTADEYKQNDFNFISGASMMLNPLFLRDIGLMNEAYFLYFEELDWSVRNSGRYKLGYCENAVFYHKEGASIGGNSRDKKNSSLLSDYYMIRNRILFTKTYYPYCLPTIYLGLIYAMVNRLRRGQYKRIGMIFKLMMGVKDESLEKHE